MALPSSFTALRVYRYICLDYKSTKYFVLGVKKYLVYALCTERFSQWQLSE